MEFGFIYWYVLVYFPLLTSATYFSKAPVIEGVSGVFHQQIDYQSGKVLQVNIESINKENNTVSYLDDNTKELVTVSILGGSCKLQWKCDWAMRWFSLGVDYEMAGKDLSESVILSSRILKVLGKSPPSGFSYELFLDSNGEKISKSNENFIIVGIGINLIKSPKITKYPTTNIKDFRKGTA